MRTTHTSGSRRFAALAVAALLGAPVLAVLPADAADEVTINLIGINDFHGRIDDNTVKFAGTVEQVRQAGGAANSLLVSAGDNVGASLFASSAQRDIPTIDVLNALHLDASAAGNHELDWGAADLTGIEDPTESINDTVDELKALADPPDIIVASIHEGAWWGAGTLDQNAAGTPEFKKIIEETDPAVDAIFMGHTHQVYAYDAPIPGEPGRTRPVLQTGDYGRNVGNIKLRFDRDAGTVTSYTMANVARTTSADADLVAAFPRVAAVKSIVDAAIAYAADVLKAVTTLSVAGPSTTTFGRLTMISASPSSGGGTVTLAGAGETPLSSVIGDDGWARFTLPRNLPIGTHTLTLTYLGDSANRGSTTTHALLVTKAGSKLAGQITTNAE